MLTMENPSPTLETCGDLNGDDYRKNYSKSFQKFVDKCLLRDPEKRYGNSCNNYCVNTIVERPSYGWCTCTYISSYYMYMYHAYQHLYGLHAAIIVYNQGSGLHRTLTLIGTDSLHEITYMSVHVPLICPCTIIYIIN